MKTLLEEFRDLIQEAPPCTLFSEVKAVSGPLIKTAVLPAAVGDIAEISGTQGESFKAEIIGFNSQHSLLSSLDSESPLRPGAKVRLSSATASGLPAQFSLGCIVNARGEKIETLENAFYARNQNPALPGLRTCPSFKLNLNARPPGYLERKAICEIFHTGVSSIDSFLTLGRGQRICILAEPGVGKSTLISQILKSSDSDVNVLALIGERGREVGEFIQESLNEESLKNTVLVVSTSDEPALLRARAAEVATAIAEHFRSNGQNVLLAIDSLSRYLRALREIGLAAGEIPVRRGYPPSVFSKLPRLIERAGTDKSGSITGLYTVLLSGEMEEDPMIEELKGLTDGHIVLSRKVAESGIYPAIDLLRSLSRLQTKLLAEENLELLRKFRQMYARYQNEKELLALGGAAEPELERAKIFSERLELWLRKSSKENLNHSECFRQLAGLI